MDPWINLEFAMPMPLLRRPPFVLLDDSRKSSVAGQSRLFHDPEYIITANTLDEVPDALKRIDAAYSDGLHVAGWISYEVAASFEEKLARLYCGKAPEPLIWMMATRHMARLSPHDTLEHLDAASIGTQRRATLKAGPPDTDKNSYLSAIGKLKDYILSGDIYQVNYTYPVPLTLSGDVLALYGQLRTAQPVPYGAFIDTGPVDADNPAEQYQILSLSPELFLSRRGNQLTCKPMKGTAPRGNTPTSDADTVASLRTDEKSKAENLMIVDLIRNDLSKMARPGSVTTTDLFSVETYPTLHQMTSTVTADAEESLLPSDVIKAMFPCGSVTGAPKIRAMEIISELEDTPRGIYCGAIGHFSPPKLTAGGESPGPDWTLNVPIRTVVLDHFGQGRISIGSGIVADSDAESEYAECNLKARFLEEKGRNFHLIETLKYNPAAHHSGDEALTFLDLHMDRLQASAAYFGFPYDAASIRAALDAHTSALPHLNNSTDNNSTGGYYRLRLLLADTGAVSITSVAVNSMRKSAHPAKVYINKTRTDSRDRFLYHKTTRRDLYDREYKKASAQGFADTIFLNENGAVTEGAIHNLFARFGDQIVTPPVSAGLLPGTLRANLLRTAPNIYTERHLTVGDLEKADALYLGNSVRGMTEVILDTAPD
ncbi:aminodeoxychorismate synthase, component I [Kordiimonas sediminis]|uniref:Probable branched-chain-amino-acid aminotransferase n=1 Tax=Kordiimonas sediminis TaxID=1735581 RepID=A0A919ANA9_9PROT|nr:aminodeoxychorismate synthase component I [Kordiimonas sediminis]GHF16941.1 aminodeoxychorismate synthase, component I [Kordiimonas sediminis]